MPTRILISAALILAFLGTVHAQEPPLTLTAAVEYALNSNPDLLAARQDPASAAARLEAARAAGRPSASLSAYAFNATGEMIVSSLALVMPQNYTHAQAGRGATLNGMAMLPLYTGGRVGADKRQKAHELDSAQELVRAAENDLTLRVRTAYKKAALADLIVGIHTQRVTETTERLRVDQAKYDAGKIPLVFVLRDKAELADAQQSHTNAVRDLDIALLDLKQAMGAPLAPKITLADKIVYDPHTEDAEAVVKEADARRPELVAARARRSAAQEGVTSARSAYQPQVGLTAMGDLMHNSNMGNSGEYLVGLIASVPLVDGGLRAAQVREAQAEAAKAQRELDALRLNAEREVRVAFANLGAADQNTRTSMEAVAQAEEDHRVAKLRYDAGKGILLEVLDSLTALVRAQVNYSQALYDYSTAQDDLNRAAGRR